MPGRTIDIEVLPNGKKQYVRPKHKPKEHKEHKEPKHYNDPRDQQIADLQARLDKVEEQKEQLLIQYQDLKELKIEAVEDANRYKQDLEETQDNYEVLLARFKRLDEETKQKDKVIQRRDNEIRKKNKEIEDLQVENKVQNGTIKKLEDQNVTLRDKVTTLTDEKRILRLELEGETRLRREMEAMERREAERRAPPRRRFDNDEFLGDARFRRPMPERPWNRWDGGWPDSD